MAKRIGTLAVFLTARTEGYSAAMKKAGVQTRKMDRGVSRLQRNARNMARTLAPALGAIGIGVVASDLARLSTVIQETASKFGTVFGPETRRVQAFIDDLGTTLGLTTTRARELIATTGAIVQGFGLSQRASADFATDVTRLAGDLSSFNNVPIEDTSKAIQSALAGEREQLKRYGIVIREADVVKRAFEITGKTIVSTLTDENRAFATLSVITDKAGVAVGDLARTSDSAANQARKLTAEFGNFREELATKVLSAVENTLAAVTNLREQWRDLPPVLQDLTVALTTATVATIAYETALVGLLARGGWPALIARIGALSSVLTAAAPLAIGIAGVTLLFRGLARELSNAITPIDRATESIGELGDKMAKLKGETLGAAIASKQRRIGELEYSERVLRFLLSEADGGAVADPRTGIIRSSAELQATWTRVNAELQTARTNLGELRNLAAELAEQPAFGTGVGVGDDPFYNPYAGLEFRLEQQAELRRRAGEARRGAGEDRREAGEAAIALAAEYRAAMSKADDLLKPAAENFGYSIARDIANGFKNAADILKNTLLSVLGGIFSGGITNVFGGKSFFEGLLPFNLKSGGGGGGLSGDALTSANRALAQGAPGGATLSISLEGATLFGDPVRAARDPGSQVFIREATVVAREDGFR